MFSLRRMKTIKVLKDGNTLYIKSSILKSFLSEVTHSYFLFVGKVPQKSFCECLIGKCGLCSHVIVILLQLEHFELFLFLTCTLKLQKKKHKPIKRRKSNITTASHICLKYFRNERFATHEVTQKRQKRKDVTATPENVHSCRDTSDWLKRDVIQISSKLSNGISKCNMDVSSHILPILQ